MTEPLFTTETPAVASHPRDAAAGTHLETGCPSSSTVQDAGQPACPDGDGPSVVRGTTGGPVLDFYVFGVPSQQGSHKGYVVNGHVNITDDSKKTRPWRDTVKQAALDASGRDRTTPLLTGPVRIVLTFALPRPKGHYRTGRYAHLLRDTAPHWPSKKPDADKMWRLVGDSLKDAAIYRDDAQVVQARISKVYADGLLPGVHVRLYGMEDE